MKVNIQYQDQFGKWQHYSSTHHQPSASKIAQNRAKSTGKRHRLIEESGNLLDLLDP